MTFRINNVPTVKPETDTDFNPADGANYPAGRRAWGSGVTEADFVDHLEINEPIAVYGPIYLNGYNPGGSVSGTIQLAAQLWLNDVLVDTITDKELSFVNATRFHKLGPRTPNEVALPQISAISSTVPNHFSFATKKLKIKTKCTQNNANTERAVYARLLYHPISPDIEIDEYVSFHDETSTVVKSAADIGVPFTIMSRTGRGRLCSPVELAKSISSGGTGQLSSIKLRVDGVDVFTLGLHTLLTTTLYSALGLVSPVYVQNDVTTISNQSTVFSPPGILVQSSFELIATIASHSSPHTSTYTARVFWGKFS